MPFLTPRISISLCCTRRFRALRCTNGSSQEGRLLDVDLADIHGQHKFNFAHAAISRDASKQYLDEAFQRDFEANGPCLFRICRTTLEGWSRNRNHPDPRVRERFTA